MENQFKTSDGATHKTKQDAQDWQDDLDNREAQRLLELTVTEGHIKLMKNANLRIETYGDIVCGVCQNGKRPYGNSAWESDVVGIAGLFGEDEVDEDEDYTPQQYATIRRVHREAALCWQILQANNLSIQPGIYARSAVYMDDWKLLQ